MTAYFQRAGEEQAVAHPTDAGEVCLSVRASDSLVESLTAGSFPSGPVPTRPAEDWRSRRIAVAARAGTPPDDLEEQVVRLLATVLAAAERYGALDQGGDRRDSVHGRPAAAAR